VKAALTKLPLRAAPVASRGCAGNIGRMATRTRYSAKHLGARLDLHTLQIFMTAVETGSLSEAAVSEHLVVSAVSRRIAELERVAGTPLLERRHGGIVPTSAGRELVEQARDLKAVLERIEERLDAHRTGLRGEVRLYASPASLLDRLPAIVAAFMAQHPGVDIQIRERDSMQVVRSVHEGVAHIGVCSSYVPARGLSTFPHAGSPLVVVTPPAHPLVAHESVCFKDTLQYEHVVLHGGDSFSALLLHMQSCANSLGVPMRVRVRVENFGVVCRFVEAGAGIAIVPLPSAQLYASALNLSIVALRDEWAASRHDICIRSDAELPPAALHLVDFLKADAGSA
jgi:DNA-binding transcriptional LysR family regulator